MKNKLTVKEVKEENPGAKFGRSGFSVEYSNYNPLRKFLKLHFKELELSMDHFLNINVKEKDGFYLYNYNNLRLLPVDDAILKLCRGIVLDKKGKLYNMPFTRFFNYHEPCCDKVDISNSIIMEKFDGSCVSAWHDGDDWRVTTRGCFPPADEGADFGKLFRRLFNKFELLIPGYTYIFELMSSENPIITQYDEEFVALIGIRSLEYMNEIPYELVEHTAKSLLECRYPKIYKADNFEECNKLFDQLRDDEEGLVVVDKAFNRFKLKQESYIKMARILKLKDQDILDFITGVAELDADFDSLPEVKEKIELMELDYANYVKAVITTYNEIKDIEIQKDFAMKALKYEYSSVLFSLRKGTKFEDIPLKYKNLEIWAK